jgi:ABC-type Fe3+-hydroxamate transport system substrate-binding protein
MIEVVDQMGHKLSLEHPADRIVSLVPSQTELLSFFQLDEEVIGVTKFCIHPNVWFESKKRVGGTKNVDIDEVQQLNPDLIIANKEENTKEDIKILREKFNVYVSDVNSVEDAYEMIKGVGVLCGKEQEAVDLLDDVQDDFNELKQRNGSVLYFIWNKPYMVCGKNTFINSIIEHLGLVNVVTEDRYIEIDEGKLLKLNPDYVFLSSEPFPFNESHIKELKKITKAKIILVDGEMFSWYGSRMLKMKDYFNQLVL